MSEEKKKIIELFKIIVGTKNDEQTTKKTSETT